MYLVINFSYVIKEYFLYYYIGLGIKDLIFYLKCVFQLLKGWKYLVIEDVFFIVGKGEVVVLIGCNGVGKSILFGLVVGVIKLIKGIVIIEGWVVLMFEFGGGFYLEFIGCENIYLNVILLGFRCKEV